ncbi:FtsX-like permease family protein [Planctomycetes bacterium K23_9]|uniref:FtsX-like permease family protein n=2 Tax=Stieleria marina TaxID=1930275 RepID=A0A517P1M4_9BACT|nr:FtsX-like permease family protein [Planctomycetes bacterium K23_9]
MVAAGVRHNWRVSAAVALGVATATAVIVGALLVGDSMRGSLRALTVERLGSIDSVLIPGAFFESQGIAKDDVDPVALVLFSSGVVESSDQDDSTQTIRRAGNVQIVGCDDDFWELDNSGIRPKALPKDNDVVLNQSTAAELGVSVGDQVTVRLPVEQAVPADSPLGRRDIQTEGLPRMKVVDIVPDRGLGRFSITASQASPQNIFVSRATINDALDRQGQANALLFSEPIDSDQLNVDLDDLGLQLKRVRQEFQPKASETSETIFDYYSLNSDRLLLPSAVAQRVTQTLPADSVTPVTTYLANALETIDAIGDVAATVTYSTITAMDSTDAFPLDYTMPPGADSNRVPLVVNNWTADRLSVEVGSEIRVAYFEPEVEKGKEIERYFDAVVTAIVPITKPSKRYYRSRPATFDKAPTIYNDANLTPSVPGVTDQDSISDWDLPFKLERTVPTEDDVYWQEHRLTPKAFLPLKIGRRLFGSRFGDTTGIRIALDAAPSVESLEKDIRSALSDDLADLGWSVHPIKAQQLAASKGTTPFDALFLSLSFFVIFAAVMLIAMLFRLGLIQRLHQFGTLLAVGWTPKRLTKLTLWEGLTVAAFGVALGIAGGVIYAKLVLWALRTLWVGAVTVPFLEFHWTPTSLLIGCVTSFLVSAATLWVSIRSITKTSARALLTGRDTDQQSSSKADPSVTAKRSRLPMVAAITAIVAVLIALAGAIAGGQASAGGFVGGGMLLLVAILTYVYFTLKEPRHIADSSDTTATFSTTTLAARNASRHPLRSTLTVGLMATAAFLIIAITAFRLQPSDRGAGGFALIAQTAQPLFRDLNDSDMQSDTFGPDRKLFSNASIASLRMRAGQDASCNNLYQASRPTVLGIPESFSPPLDFDWAASQSVTENQSVWDLLKEPADGTLEDPIPMILDQNTAMWSLQMYGGVGPKAVRSFEYEDGKPVYFRVVGLLLNSILQGRLMIGEENFQKAFPDISGYQFFLIGGDNDDQDAIASTLENRLGDVGMDVSDTKTVLSGMLAVQNTYLRTFQSLGALGLLLGTIGLAVSQLRSIYERRQELAVMRALGFSRHRLAMIVMGETTTLLLLGIGCGAICAVLAVLPYALLSGIAPPIAEPLVIVAGIIVFGMIAGLVAVTRVLRMPLMDSLRAQ